MTEGQDLEHRIGSTQKGQCQEECAYNYKLNKAEWLFHLCFGFDHNRSPRNLFKVYKTKIVEIECDLV